MEDGATDTVVRPKKKGCLSVAQRRWLEENAVYPHSSLRRYWDLTIFFITTYNVLNIPLRISFTTSGLSWYWYFIDYFSDAFLWVDVVWRFFVGYNEMGIIVTDRARIKKKYFLSRDFVLDVAGTVPSDILPWFWGGSVQVHAYFRLVRVLRLNRFPGYFRNWEQSTSRPVIFRMLKMSAMTMVISHWTACIMVLANFYNGGQTPFPDASVFQNYIQYLDLAVSLLTGLGANALFPDNVRDITIMLVVLFMGIGVFAAVVGGLVAVLTGDDAAADDFRKKLDTVNLWMAFKRIDKKLQTRIRLYYEYVWARSAGLNDDSILADMPVHLRAAVAQDLNQNIISKVPLFERCQDEGFIQCLLRCLHPEVYLPGDYIVREGEMGSCMFFITSGKVSVQVTGLGEVNTLGEGKFFGEVALLFKAKRNASIRAKGYVDVFVLSKEDVDNVLLDFSEYAEIIYTLAQERLATDQNAAKRKRMQEGLMSPHDTKVHHYDPDERRLLVPRGNAKKDPANSQHSHHKQHQSDTSRRVPLPPLTKSSMVMWLHALANSPSLNMMTTQQLREAMVDLLDLSESVTRATLHGTTAAEVQ